MAIDFLSETEKRARLSELSEVECTCGYMKVCKKWEKINEERREAIAKERNQRGKDTGVDS